MVAYFDTSAFVPLLASEPSSAQCRDVWRSAERIAATRLLFVETSSALARIDRSMPAPKGVLSSKSDELLERWRMVQVLDLDDSLMTRAASLAGKFGLKGYDAVHCAAAASIEGVDVVAVSSDRQLLAAWHRLGVATIDPAA